MYHYISYYNLTLYIMFNQNPLLYIFSVFAIVMLHRVAFLRKSSCRSATLFVSVGVRSPTEINAPGCAVILIGIPESSAKSSLVFDLN